MSSTAVVRTGSRQALGRGRRGRRRTAAPPVVGWMLIVLSEMRSLSQNMLLMQSTCCKARYDWLGVDFSYKVRAKSRGADCADSTRRHVTRLRSALF